jgi:aspartyl-tRNA(Asn)/glutamyl-tRNA(Gln) amidotransferase subunit B
MPKGSTKFGTRVEIKNVNSFKFIEKAIEYEIARQIEVVKAGGRVVQETRGYDSFRNVTTVQRSKEEAMDYRYFPDPDLIEVQVSPAWIEQVRGTLPELPSQRKQRYMAEMGLNTYDAGALTSSKAVAEFFEQTIEILAQAGIDRKAAGKPTANWISGELTRLANEEGIEIGESKIKPSHLAVIVKLSQSQTISSTGAKQVILTVWKTGDDVLAIVDREGLKQVSDVSALDPAIDQVIAAHPAQVAEFKSGKEKILGFFVGQVMKATGGKANPALLQDLIRKKLSS